MLFNAVVYNTNNQTLKGKVRLVFAGSWREDWQNVHQHTTFKSSTTAGQVSLQKDCNILFNPNKNCSIEVVNFQMDI